MDHHQYTSYTTTPPASYTTYDVRTSGVIEKPLRQSYHGAEALYTTSPTTSYANFTTPTTTYAAPAGGYTAQTGNLGGSYTQVSTSNYGAPAGYTIPSTIPQTYTAGAYSAGAYTTPTSYTAHTTTAPIDVSHHHHGGETVKQSRQVQSLPAPNQPRQSVLSPYRHSMYPEFELVEDLPDRSNLLNSLNTLLLKSPARESLLSAPVEVQIKRDSVLSPAQILVQSLLKEKYEDGTVYEGESRNGKQHGRGRLTFRDGRIFEGEFNEGRAQGKGVFFYKNGSVCYEGEIADNVFHGKGVLRNENPAPVQGPIDVKDFGAVGNSWTRYEGEFRAGKRHGNGVLYLRNGDKFSGEFKNDQVDGKGTLEQRDGRVLQGVWSGNVQRQ